MKHDEKTTRDFYKHPETGERPKERPRGNTGKFELLRRGQLIETAPKILHSKGCFEAV
ncbi:MAG: hypothetical protein ISS70_08210 [Phycisphaerae bacterium]|nr:hypothetical protein [Phycisphaerae bacterium]